MTHWRQQQRQDPYFRKAKEEGYRARSAYKLLQIQEKFHVLRRGDTVIDLGAAPGSWSQVASKIVGEQGRIVALDLQTIEPLSGVVTLQGDMTAPEVQAQIVETAGGKVNVVLSDAAPPKTGIKLRDHTLSIELGYVALSVAEKLLVSGGNLVIKLFQGEDLPGLLHAARARFRAAKLHTPPATRSESWEVFLVALGFKGNEPSES